MCGFVCFVKSANQNGNKLELDAFELKSWLCGRRKSVLAKCSAMFSGHADAPEEAGCDVGSYLI